MNTFLRKNDIINSNKNNIVKLKKNEFYYDDTLMINYTCHCKNYFINSDVVLLLLPCCHFIHELCLKKIISENNNKCPVCDIEYNKVVSHNKLNSSKYYKIQEDLYSILLDENQSFINYYLLPLSMIKITSFLNKLLTISNEKDIFDGLDYLMKACNIKINVIDSTTNNPIIYNNKNICWKNPIDNKKLVIISNHSHYLDSFILYYLFRCGFVASDFINKIDIGRIIAKKCNLLVFKRGVDTNMVEKIKEYLNICKKIVIFPEGSMGNNNYLRRFRTGAFYTNSNICPVVIKYRPFVWDDDYKKFLFKLITQQEIIVDVYISDLFKPPFLPNDIENIRNIMCNLGNLKKSRVTNKFLKE